MTTIRNTVLASAVAAVMGFAIVAPVSQARADTDETLDLILGEGNFYQVEWAAETESAEVNDAGDVADEEEAGIPGYDPDEPA